MSRHTVTVRIVSSRLGDVHQRHWGWACTCGQWRYGYIDERLCRDEGGTHQRTGAGVDREKMLADLHRLWRTLED